MKIRTEVTELLMAKLLPTIVQLFTTNAANTEYNIRKPR